MLMAACSGSPDDTDDDADPGGDTPTVPIPGAVATPPLQATSGPGGSDYRYAAVLSERNGLGGGAYSLMIPDGAGTDVLPVVYLLHGYGTLDLTPYQSWAEHLARHGAIVIYPAYQLLVATPVGQYTPNAVQAIKDALARLDAIGGVRADTSRVIAIGHSLGGAVAANVAAVAGSAGIPQPRALMTINPSNQSPEGLFVMPMEDLGQIPSGTLQLSLFSDDDQRIADTVAKAIFYGSTNVSARDKNYIVVNSDAHGTRRLQADHFAALAARSSPGALYPPDALDFYGYWKLADALMAAAFDGRLRDVALGNGSAAQRYMGTWGDGVPVVPLTVVDAP